MSGRRSLRYASPADMPAGMRRLLGEGVPSNTDASEQPKPKKYKNQITHVDGIRFDSKREANYYRSLKLRIAAGEVEYFLRQVPIHLPGGTRLVVDFLVFFVDGRQPEYVDAKGRETKEFKIKQREVQHHYPIRIVLV